METTNGKGYPYRADNLVNSFQNSIPQDTENTVNSQELNPQFDDLSNPETLKNGVMTTKEVEAVPHTEMLELLLEKIERVDFEALANPRKAENYKLTQKDYVIYVAEHVLHVAESNHFGLCNDDGDTIYKYNGAYWQVTSPKQVKSFLGESAKRAGVPEKLARFYKFRDLLLEQFLEESYLVKPEADVNTVQINLLNGTLEITPESRVLRPFNRADFLTYQLQFEYDEKAGANLFHKYLNRVLPDKEVRMVLQEYLGYLFIKNGNPRLKDEKVLMLTGGGFNGKSVLFEVVNAMLGDENVSVYSLKELTEQEGYRAEIGNKLLNYASEEVGKMNNSVFKQLASGERVAARSLYKTPFMLKQYAKLMFNCNTLPKDVENTYAFFRRFLIIPFEVTIPKDEQDKQLPFKIIKAELSGVLNWVLEGLDRLLEKGKFTDSEVVNQILERYKTESDTPKMFLEDNDYEACTMGGTPIKELYLEYAGYCNDGGFLSLNRKNFTNRLKASGITVTKKNVGMVAYVSQKTPF